MRDVEYRLDMRGAHLAGGLAGLAAAGLAALAPGAAGLRFSLAAVFAVYIWVRALMFVRRARWGVRGGALFFQTGRFFFAQQLLPLGRIGVLHCHRLPLGLCFLAAQAAPGLCVIPFVRRADAEAFLAGWLQCPEK